MLGDFVEERANGAPCSFGSQYGYPQIAAGSGCRGNRWVPADTTSVVRFNELAAAGRFVVLLMKGAEPPALEGEWNCEVVEPLPSGPWTVCINSG